MKQETYKLTITMPDKDKLGADWLKCLIQEALDWIEEEGRFFGRYTVGIEEE